MARNSPASALALTLTLALALTLCRCGADGSKEIAEYADNLAQFQGYHRQIDDFLAFAEEAEADSTVVDESHVQSIRDLFGEYKEEVLSLSPVDHDELRSVHGMFLRTLDKAVDKVEKRSGGPARQVREIAIDAALFRDEVTGKVFPAFGALMTRHGLDEKYNFSWTQ